ncbi:DNA/RNA helicase domain-containing protein [Tetragenococcus halophilus]|uniref:DNA/RNA helicase domain-containing protein n=1 Tax=Tetragenococcus halophilus TaxID=51669 RepID=UPI00077CCB2B|nr:DNA/RNA helicase domain-containing protein [Tetragenococcus halophilus]
MDLITYTEAVKNLNKESMGMFKDNYRASTKDQENEDIKSLLQQLRNECVKTDNDLSLYTDDFWIGFKIPQIGEEFDLLRFGTNFNINIELKSDCIYEKMLRQLQRKKYYLKFLEQKTVHFVYSSENCSLYWINEEGKLEKVLFKTLYYYLYEQNVNKGNKFEIEKLFNPNNYLISPFNTTEKFLEDDYFMTNHQQKIKNQFFNKINIASSLFMLEGAPGTGKTLLTYDLVKECIKKRLNVLIVHVGRLNAGQIKLRSKHDWNICAIKDINDFLKDDLDVIIIDESQRLDTEKFNLIYNFSVENGVTSVFSLDEAQCLHNNEINRHMRDKIIKITEKENQYKLKEKIRSNKELADFIKKVNKIPKDFTNKIENPNGHIKVKYFNSKQEAYSYVISQKKFGWKHLTYSNDLYKKEPLDNLIVSGEETPHGVIGQEFDKVIIMIDDNFGYSLVEKYYKLVGKTFSYYNAAKMLFQNMTRARKELCLVVIDNRDFFKKVLSILQNV